MRNFLICFLLFILIILLPSTFALQINEVMYAPTDGNEWIELYNPENKTINFSNWNLSDNLATDTLECCAVCNLSIAPYSYALIADKDTSMEADFCVDDNSIGNGLGNTEDSITLTNGSEEISFSYEKSMGGYLNNLTLEARLDDSWGEGVIAGGTPNKENSIWDFSIDFATIIITEILPDPFGEEKASKPAGEWVELYNFGEKSVDLKGLFLKDEKDDAKLPIADNKVFNSTIICAGCYKVIYSDGDSDFSLNQDYDEVRLFLEDILLTSVSYAGSTEGMSWSLIEGEWFETIPTPEEDNVFVENCDWSISLGLENSIFKGIDLNFSVDVERYYGFSQEITVRGKIEDAFGKTIKEYKPWTNQTVVSTISKSYSPNLGEEIYQVSFWFENLVCSEDDESNNQATKLIAINPLYKENTSTIEIEKIYLGSDDEAEWGDQFTVKVIIYKGDETKKSVQLWVEIDGEKVSKTTKIKLEDKYKEYPLTLPIQLDPNCNGEMDSGNALLVLEAFGLREEQEIKMDGVDSEVCKDYLSYLNEVEKEDKKFSFDLVNFKPTFNSGEIIPLKLQLLNDGKQHTYKIWSYLYRGNKCYSCEDSSLERDAEAQYLTLSEGEAEVIELLLKLDSGLDGDYKLKIKLKKDDQKTDKELTKSVLVNPGIELQEKEGSLDLSSEIIGNDLEINLKSEKTMSEKMNHTYPSSGFVIYESSSVKAKKLMPYLLILTFALLSVVLLMKKS
jgi:hypothetical protein